ncbi:cellulose synthase operon C domain protein [Granulicella mallensis MP5ACTX8]|uniref:Cellulose synthase operon C domain protein n=2 Tax=Granulicella mallensis TaxID=940614 RepID=G8NVC6_GRAMM|nr:cellulose synthase operon C domain protein [Granulicella mallensis MP5ACTX8]
MAKMSSPVLKRLLPIVFCLIVSAPVRAAAADSPAIKMLLNRATSQAQSGHLDLAISTWKQVLAADPNNIEALRDLAGAEMRQGHQEAADIYIQRLRKSGANETTIRDLLAIHTQSSDLELLHQAAILTKSGKYGEAMEIYRQLYGKNPPAGEVALVYYDTEAALPADRVHAIEGLRKLAQQFPSDERYSVTLGRVLTYDANTRTEGISLLRRYPNNQDAGDALKQALGWAERSEGSSLAAASEPSTPQQRPPMSGVELAAGYRALNSGNLLLADQHFRASLAHEVTHGQANAGLGYVSMRQQDFSEAVHQFEQARSGGDQDASLMQALSTSRFFSFMKTGQSALDSDDTTAAIANYRSALALKPDNPDALSALGGAFLRTGHPKDAVPYLERAVRVDSSSSLSWRGLFLAQSQSAEFSAAISTAERIPVNLRTKLENDPEFLQSLAADYAAIGQQSQSDHVLTRALALAQADSDNESSTAAQLRYASLLLAAKRYNTASRVYRRILTTDSDNGDAWSGLVSSDHLAGRDAEALREFRQMPASVSSTEQDNPGFLSMLAGIYQSQDQISAAREALNRALKIAPSLSIRLQLASMELSSGDKQYAVEEYARIVDEHPGSKEAWIGWIEALHATTRDREALGQIREMPEDLSATLQNDAEYQQTLASIYSGAGNKARAFDAMEQANDIYASQGISPPISFQIQEGWLFLQSGQDARLSHVIQNLSNNDALTESQQAQLTQLYATWAVQRAAQLNLVGKHVEALAVLAAALRAFPSDISINNSLAAAYAADGDPKRAVMLYNRQDISKADASICEAAVRAALAAGDQKQALSWLQTSLDRFGKNGKILELAAEFEVKRGDSRKAAAYYRAALEAAGPPSIAELTASTVTSGSNRGASSASQDLFRMLSSSNDKLNQNQFDEIADTSRSNREALWPVRSTSNSDDNLIAHSEVEERGGYASLPPSETSAARRKSSHKPAVNQDLATDTYHDDLIPPPATVSHTATSYSARTNNNEDSHVANAPDYSPRAANPHINRVTHREAATGLAPDLPVSEAEAHYPAIPHGTLSDQPLQETLRDNTPPRHRTFNTGESIPTADSTLLDAMLTPVPSQTEALPPLTGSSNIVPQPLTPRQQIQDHLDAIESSSSPYLGGDSSVNYHNGQSGFDRLTIFSADVEGAAMINPGARFTLVVHPTLLQGGTTDAGATYQLGTLPLGAVSNAQTASGVGGELQLRTRSVGAALGYTPHGFPVENVTGRFLLQPNAGPVTLSFERQPIQDSQLSYAGLYDPGSATSSYSGNIWGGVITNAASVQVNHGDGISGWYMEIGGQYITGHHVENNRRIDGYGGAYWSVWENPNYGKLTVGMNFFGMHYANNQRLFTYGNGGYFSPEAYLLSNIPVTFDGHHGTRFHYQIAGAAGIQAFQEGASPYFPIDNSLQVAAKNPFTTEHTSVGVNYNLTGEGAYLITKNWHLGAFFSLDNANEYNNDRIGFFLRYAFHPQSLESPSGPTGLIKSQGLRPLLIP